MERLITFDRESHRLDVNFGDYYWFDAAFTPKELKMIEAMTSKLQWEQATTIAGDSTEHRKSKIKWCPQSSEWEWVYNKLHDLIYEANRVMWKMDLTLMPEPIQYTEYYEGGGHYDWHMDCGIGSQNRRKISVTVQLSHPDDYEGGELEFNTGNVHQGPRVQGAAVVFPSFFMHRVTPVTKGTRKSFVLWVGGEPYR